MRLLVWFVGGLMYLVPNHLPPFMSFYNEFLAFAFLLLMVVQQRGAFSLSIGVLFIGGVSVLPWLQYLGGQIYFLGDAFLFSVYIASFAMAVAVGREVSDKVWASWLWLLIWVGIISFGIALWQFMRMPPVIWFADIPPTSRPFANIGQSNNMATLFALSGVAVWGLWERRYLGNLVAALLGLLFIFSAVSTQSRTVLLGVCVLAVIYPFIKARLEVRTKVGGVFLLSVLYVAFYLVLPYVAEGLYVSSETLAERAGAMERLAMWAQFWHAIGSSPLWGHGWGQGSVAQTVGALHSYFFTSSEYSHNLLLDLIVWNGPWVGAGIVAFFVLWGCALIRRVRSSLDVALLFMCGFIFLHAMLEFPLYYAYFLIPFGLMLGRLEASRFRRLTHSPAKGFILVPWCLGVLLLAVVWFDYRELENDYRLMRFEAAGLSVRQTGQAPKVVLLTNMREFIRFARTPASESMTAEELAWMGRVAHRYPFPPSLFRYSLALALNGEYDAAREQLAILGGMHKQKYYLEAMASLREAVVRYPQLALFIEYLESHPITLPV
ncbi:PglL family O-oligosaccharyltransferase [Pseudomonas tohonis]|uniref:PglL family O-oligosaccharyltransferase n=1 Tax=Pseudomonas tohonis TaxID=2725477 RepID=UPI001F2A7F29|nr:O-antigen ligase family protein [Pseudomonas tohonis]